MTDKAYFHLNELFINTVLYTALIITYMNFMNVPFTIQKWQCGVGYQL